MKKLLLLLSVPLIFSCGNNLDTEITEKMIVGGSTGEKIHISADGDKYAGEWKSNKKNGLGTNTSASGDKYVGRFKNNKKNGLGTFTFSNGAVYKGLWENNTFIGK